MENILLQLHHSLNRFLNRRHLIHAKAIIQINSLNAQAFQTLIARLVHIVRARINQYSLPRSTALVPEFCSEEALIALSGSLEPFSYQVFGILVNVCTVPEGLAEFERSIEDFKTRLGDDT